MKRNFVFSEDEFYHIYSRGVNKAEIFLDNYDKDRFQKLLFLSNSKKPLVYKDFQGRALESIDRGETYTDIVAYCLMPNHFHLLFHEKTENGIKDFLQKLLTAYSMYFNRRHGRTGVLFESRFKARHADRDEYLKYLFSYIHLNPVKLIDPGWKEDGIKDKSKAKQFLDKYKYSSYVEYTQGSTRPERLILNREAAPEYFESTSDFDGFISEWLEFAEFKD